MKEWIVSIGVVVIILSIISLLIPDGKMGKYVKCVFSLLIVFVVLKPIVFIGEGDQIFTNDYDGVQVETTYQEEYLSYIKQKKIYELEKNCEKLMENHTIFNSKIKVVCQNDSLLDFSIKKVEINLQNAVIKSNKEHIDIIEEAVNSLAEYLDVSKTIVEICQ